MKANEKLVLDMIRAVEERNAERILQIYDPDVEFHWPPSLPGYGGTFRGREVVEMNTAFTDAWDPLQPTEEARRIHPRVVATNDDEVVVHYHQRGTDQSDRSCDSEVLAIYRVEGGKVSRLQMFCEPVCAIGTAVSSGSTNLVEEGTPAAMTAPI
jgi:ketosteroid isomerase-like protein